VRLRTFYLADLDLYALAARAEALRAGQRDHELEGGATEPHLDVTD
jgi:hypothetical protein